MRGKRVLALGLVVAMLFGNVTDSYAMEKNEGVIVTQNDSAAEQSSEEQISEVSLEGTVESPEASEAKAEAETRVEEGEEVTESKAETEAEAETEQKTETKTQTESGSETESKLETEAEEETEEKAETGGKEEESEESIESETENASESETTETAETTEESTTEETTEEETTETVEETETEDLTMDGAEGTTFTVDDMTYEVLSETTVKVTGTTGYLTYDTTIQTEMVIPAQVTYEQTTYSVVEIGDFAFASYAYEYGPQINDQYKAHLGIDKVTVSPGIQKIGKGAFYRSQYISEIVLPDTVKEIGEGAFCFNKDRVSEYGDNILLTVNIPESVKTIGNYAYCGVAFSNELKIPDGVQSIGKYAFACDGDYSGIDCVEIPASVKDIMAYAFDIKTLQRVALWNADPAFSLGTGIESNYNSVMFGEKNSMITIYVPDSSIETYEKSILHNAIPNAVYKSIEEYAVLKDSPIKFLYGGEEITSQITLSTNSSKSIKVDKGTETFNFSDIQWSFSYYGGNTKLTQNEIEQYFTYEAKSDGTVVFTAKNQIKNFTVYAEVDGYKPASVDLVLIAGYTNESFQEAVKALTTDDINKMKVISAGNTAAASQLEVIQKKAQEITAGCDTDLEKIEAVHRWVSYHISYDYDSLNYIEADMNGQGGSVEYVMCPTTHYSVLQNRYTVCEGYARLSEALLRSVGIPTAYISGYANGSFYENRCGHAWNMAYDGTKWIYFDATWDGKGRVSDHYFGSGSGGSTTNWFNFEENPSTNTDREYRYADLGQELVINESEIAQQRYYTIFEGDTIKLSLYNGEQTNLQTNDTDIISLTNDGTICGLKPGMASISASTDRIYDDTIYIRVMHNEPFAFDKEEITIGTQDNNYQLNILYGEDKAWSFVTLKSSDTSVVSITEEGVLEPKAVGTATITAECVFGEEGKHKASCTVNIVDGTRFGNDGQFDYFILSEPNETENGTVEIAGTRLGKSAANSIDKLTVPSNVMFNGKTYDVIGIGKEAFAKELEFEDALPWITEFVLPETLQYIDDYAFAAEKCAQGTLNRKINFPASLKWIGKEAFLKANLKCNVVFPEDSQLESIGDNDFNNNPDMISLDLSNCKELRTIGDGAFVFCSRYEDVEWKVSLPEGLETIGAGAFMSNAELFQIQIPSTVKTIGAEAFRSTGIKETVDLRNVEALGEYMFYNCRSLEKVILSDELKTLPAGIFSGDVALSRVVSASKAEEAGGIEKIAAGTVILPESVEEIGEQAFATCMALESVEAKGVKSLGIEVFNACRKLKTVQLSNTLREIPDKAFYWCDQLESFSFCDTIERIGIEAFSDCDLLGKASGGAIVLGSGLKEIGDKAFYTVNPGSINKVTINSKIITKIGEECFTTKPVFYIYKEVSDICKAALESCASGFVYIVSPIFVESITLSEEQAKMCVGGTLQLKATVLPNDADFTKVTWSSSDTTVAEVSKDGVITAKKKGTAVIAATTTDGTALTASCTVTVVQPVKEVHIFYAQEQGKEGIKADQEEIKLHGSNEQLFLTATVGPEDADSKEIIWTNTNEQVATLEKASENSYVLRHINGAENEGTTVIRLEAKDGNGAETYVRIVYALNSYTLTIDPKNGKTPTTSVIKENELLKLPNNPTKSGYTFAGWYLAGDTKKPVNVNTKAGDDISDAQKNINIEAKWILASEKGKIDIADMLFVEKEETGYPAQSYTGKKLSPKVTLKNGQKALRNKTDYTVTYGDETHNNTDMGTNKGSILIEGCGQYTGKVQVYFDIYGDISRASVGEYDQKHKLVKFAPRNIEDYPKSESIELLTKEGGTSTVVVQFMKNELQQGRDYELVYSSNREAGTAYVTVVGKGNYRGSKETAYTIKGTDISKLKFDAIAPVTYTGQEIECLYAANKSKLTSEQLATADSKITAVSRQNGEDVTITLINGVDYVVGYSNNTNAGTASVTIAGIGKYTGNKTLKFKILPRNIAGVAGEYEAVQGTFSDGVNAFSYTGLAIKPTITVTAKVDNKITRILAEGTDYKIKYSNNTKQSQDTREIKKKPAMILTGTKNYKGSITLNFEITKADINAVTVDAIPDQKAPSGQKKPIPKPVVKYNGKTLKNGTDYTLSYTYEENTGTIQITGKNNFVQTSKTVSFQMKNQLITDNGISIKVEPNLVYNGSRNDSMPTVTVTKGSGKNKEILKEDIDYEVTYNTNINAGKKKTVTVSGIGSYGGSKTLTYNINPKNINAAALAGSPDVKCLTDFSNVKFLYTGNAVKPKVKVVDSTVIVNGEPRVLVENQDYTLRYSNNSAITATKNAVITIVGKGNYTGTLRQTVPFKITSWNFEDQLKNGTAWIEIADQDYTGKAQKPKAVISVRQPDGSVETLKSGTAYSVTYRNNIQAADKAAGDKAPTALITPNAKKGVTGTTAAGKTVAVEKTFTIKPLRLENAVIKKIADQIYKGKEIKPVPNVKVGKITLQMKKGDFICVYENQNKKGTAKVIIKPGNNGNFAGETSVEYFIK